MADCALCGERVPLNVMTTVFGRGVYHPGCYRRAERREIDDTIIEAFVRDHGLNPDVSYKIEWR